MLFRASAAICGAIITFAVFADAARGQDATFHSSAGVHEARGVALVGAASTYNPFQPGTR